MTVVRDRSVPTTGTQIASDTPILSHPWDDYTTVMRHANRARAAGDLQRALAFYTRAIELDVNSAQAWTGLASSTSNQDEAIIAWGYVLAIEPNDEARTMLSACVSEKIKQSDTEDVESLVEVGRRLAKAGQSSYAYRLFKRATRLEVSSEEAWLWRAGVAGDMSETIDCLNHVLEINPRNGRARAGLEWAAAKQQAMLVSADASRKAGMLLEEGQRALREGDRARAHHHFVRATDLDPRNAMAWLWRGSSAQDIDEAIGCMEQVLAIDPAVESAKDALWWLRIQKMRELSPVLTNAAPQQPTITTPAITDDAGRVTLISSPKASSTNNPSAIILIAVAVLVICLLVSLVVVVLAIRLV